jgi:hypothetical protein
MVVIGCAPTDDYFIADEVQTPSTTLPPAVPPPVCGNDLAEGAEGCDGIDLRGASCATLSLETGTLGCTADCRFDISGCSAKATVCGDGVADPDEICDGSDLRGDTCELLGLSGGTLACTAACRFDPSRCTVSLPVCGDGAAQPTEACDGFDLKGQTCVGLGLPAGTLTCDNACTYNTSKCNAPVAMCGNGRAEPPESCDGADLGDQDCESVGLGPGTLACDANCGFDTSDCAAPVSGCENPGAGGASAECCEPVAEICDGQSNDCDDLVDEGACPAGCSARLFGEHLYLLCVNESAALQLDYNEATAACDGADSMLGLGVSLELARIESAQENQFLRDWIRETTSSEGMIWMGANDIAREGIWVWGQGERAVQFFTGNLFGGGVPFNGRFHDFLAGRPNSANGTDEDCGGFDSEADWHWNDRLCTQGRLGYVCETAVDVASRPMPPGPPMPQDPWGMGPGTPP